jgi:hypothetical protein
MMIAQTTTILLPSTKVFYFLIIYEKALKYFPKEFGLPDNYFAWYRLTLLHVWSVKIKNIPFF